MRPITWIITILAMAVPLFVWPGARTIFNHPKSLLMVSGISLAVFLYLRNPSRKLDETTHWLMGLLIALNVASFFYTRNPYYTKQAVILNLTCLAAFYLTALYGDAKRIFQAFVAAGVIVSVVAILQMFWIDVFPAWFSFKRRITSTIGNANYVGCFLLFPIFAALGLIRGKRSKLSYVALALFLFVLALIRVRSAAFGLGIGLITWMLYQGFRIPWKRLGMVLIPCLVLLPALLLIKPIRDRVEPEAWLRVTSLQYRVKYWQASWHLIKQAPFLGHGLWAYRKTVYDAQAQIQQKDPTYFDGYRKPQPRRAHNDYLETVNDGGVLLLAACGLFIFWTFRQRKSGPLESAAFACFIAVLASAVFFFPFRLNTTMFSSALMLGILRGRP